MKRKSYTFKSSIAALKKCKESSYRQFFFSAISLFIVMAIFITSSTAWFSIETAKMDVSNFVLNCGKGLRVNDSGTSDFQLTNVQKYIYPASSIDGRNLFFPTDGSDFSSKTEDMTFRSANVGDKNQNYIQIDFTLTAQANNTSLYINDEETSIMIENNSRTSTTLAAPLRLAIWSATAENGYPNTPVVFNPTSKTYTTAAVKTVNRSTGELQSTGRQVSHTFSDYAYGGEPVATLSKGVETKFKIIIWLEGTDPKCTEDRVIASDIKLKIKFTTSWDKTQAIRFKDKTNGAWIKQKLNSTQEKYSLTLHYYNNEDGNSTGEETDFTMYPVHTNSENNTDWTCNLPGDMHKNITFILRPPAGSLSPTYIFCVNSKTQSTDISETDYQSPAYSNKTLDRGVNRQYVVDVPANTAYPSVCRGYWMALGDSDGGGVDIGDLDGDDF